MLYGKFHANTGNHKEMHAQLISCFARAPHSCGPNSREGDVREMSIQLFEGHCEVEKDGLSMAVHVK
jgi:hypothetical protein